MQIAYKPHLEILKWDPDYAHLRSTCPSCGEHRDLEPVDFNSLHDWVTGGRLIQVAFPELDASTREALMTGICDACWDEMGGDE